MADVTPLSFNECDSTFAPALGAYVLSGGLGSRAPRYGPAGPTIEAAYSFMYVNDLIVIQKEKLKACMNHATVMSLGTACFGFVFKRHKKIAQGQDGGQIGRCFGVTPTETESRKQYPGANATWNQTPNSDYWFSSMSRNAFAHGQWGIIGLFVPDQESNHSQNLRLYNQRGSVITFDTTLSLFDIRDIIIAALLNFINEDRNANALLSEAAVNTLWVRSQHRSSQLHLSHSGVDGGLSLQSQLRVHGSLHATPSTFPKPGTKKMP